MPLNREDVEKLCLLARIEITTEEIADVQAKLSDIVKLVDQLQAVDTSVLIPMADPLDRSQILRPVEVTEIDERERFQRNAPLVDKALYLVPKVIE